MNTELVIETDDGNTFVADVRDFGVEVEGEQFEDGAGIHEVEYRFEVSTMIDTDSGEEY